MTLVFYLLDVAPKKVPLNLLFKNNLTNIILHDEIDSEELPDLKFHNVLLVSSH